MTEVDGATLEGKREIILSLMRDVDRALECTSGGIEIYLRRKRSEIEQWRHRGWKEHQCW